MVYFEKANAVYLYKTAITTELFITLAFLFLVRPTVV